jgi:hypothetical protein
MVHWYGFHYQHTNTTAFPIQTRGVGNHIKFTRLHLGSLALRPISSSFRNSRPLIAQTPLLRTTKAYGQLLGRDFNPLAKLLLLRTPAPIDSHKHHYRKTGYGPLNRGTSPIIILNRGTSPIILSKFRSNRCTAIFGYYISCKR